MRLDEVYQAALAAGSGGIRWNSETNYIQLADENKNWVDWRYYNPNTNLFVCASSINNTKMDYAFDKVGTYIFMFAGCQSSVNVTTNAKGSQYLYNNTLISGNDRRCTLLILNAEVGQTLSATRTSSSYVPTMHLFYICPEFGTGVLNNHTVGNSTISFQDVSNRVLITANNGKDGSPAISINCTTDESETDGLYYGICSTVNTVGSASINVVSFSSGSTPVSVDVQFTFG